MHTLVPADSSVPCIILLCCACVLIKLRGRIEHFTYSTPIRLFINLFLFSRLESDYISCMVEKVYYIHLLLPLYLYKLSHMLDHWQASAPLIIERESIDRSIEEWQKIINFLRVLLLAQGPDSLSL